MATIAFLPGLPLSTAQFDDVAGALGGHDVHRLDYPGFAGRGLRPGLGFDDHVADVRDQLVTLPSPIVLVGLSFGAQLALAVAAQDPERVRALVLTNTQGGPPSDEERGMFNGAADAAEAHGSGALVEMLTGMLLAPETRDGRPEVVDRFAALVADSPGAATASGFRALAGRPDPTPHLAGIRVPALLLWGGGDQAAPVAEAEALAAGLPDARLEVIQDAGHLPPMETPSAYGQALSAFVDGL